MRDFSDHCSGKPFSAEWPSPLGPRKRGHCGSSAATAMDDQKADRATSNLVSGIDLLLCELYPLIVWRMAATKSRSGAVESSTATTNRCTCPFSSNSEHVQKYSLIGGMA